MNRWEHERVRNPLVSAMLTWTGLALGVAALGITAWRMRRARRGIVAWTDCEPETPTGGWIDPKTHKMPPEVVGAVVDAMEDILDENPDLDTDALVRQTVWELAECDEESLTSPARGQIRQIAQSVIHGRALPGQEASP